MKTILDEVRESIDQEDLENAKVYAKTLMRRQQAIMKNIANMQDEWAGIEKKLEKIYNKDFSEVPQPVGGTLAINNCTTGSATWTVPISNLNFNTLRS